MNSILLGDLQESVIDKTAFTTLADYRKLGSAFLNFLQSEKLTRIVSPDKKSANYIFFQYSKDNRNRITRPLNSNLFFESTSCFESAFERFAVFLGDLKRYQEKTISQKACLSYIETEELLKVIYTLQQCVGCIGDSFEDANQSRKRIGQLFETLIKLTIKEIGIECEPRTIKLPVPGDSGHKMPYELDVVFSRNKAILTAETKFIHPKEIVGSIKTTSKDRIDKIFLDKFLLTKFLGRNIPVVAVFLHDVQRSKKGNSIFGINSTFKTNHFLVYSVALNKLDGVYYIDPRPEMMANEKLRAQIHTFQKFLICDLWTLTGA